MSQTTWSPYNTSNRQWLLTNGEVVTEPNLEISGSGRRVRIAGTKISAYTKDLDDLVLSAVKQAAQGRGAEVWMRQIELGRDQLGWDPDVARAELHVLTQPRVSQAQTLLWWRFRHPSLPVTAILTVSLRAGYRASTGCPQTLQTSVVLPLTETRASIHPQHLVEDNPRFSQTTKRVYKNNLQVNEFIRDHKPNWDTDLLGVERFNTERAAVKALLAKVRAIEEMAEIQIPDLRNPDEPGWLTLSLHETNMNPQFLADLVDYLDGGATVAQAAELYNEMVKVLAGAGVVLPPRSENDFQAALSGNGEAVTVEVQPVIAENDTADHHHSLTMHVPSGTFIVNCALHTQLTVTNEVIAEKWEEALTLASLTGREDELLAYARRYAETEAERRTQRILAERQRNHDE
jgi:hypothetical protein